MGLSSAGEVIGLNAILAARYVSLHTAAPGDSGTSEVSTSGTGYARQGPVSFTNSGANPTSSKNSALLTFPTALGSWGTVTHFGVWSAASGGTFLGWGVLTTSKAVAVDDVVRFPINSLEVTMD